MMLPAIEEERKGLLDRGIRSMVATDRKPATCSTTDLAPKKNERSCAEVGCSQYDVGSNAKGDTQWSSR